MLQEKNVENDSRLLKFANDVVRTVLAIVNGFVLWFESFNPVIPGVLVSGWHYIGILNRFEDSIIVAVAVGLFVDLLHYHTVRYAVVSGQNKKGWALGVPIAVAVLTTVVSYAFHWLFYAYDPTSETVYNFAIINFLLAAPLPLGIPVLAWQAENKLMRKKVTRSRKFWHARIRQVLNIARVLQTQTKTAQTDRKLMQNKYKSMQGKLNRQQTKIATLQTTNKELQEINKAWQKLDTETQTLARFKAGLISATHAANIIGVKDTRTIHTRAEKLATATNGSTKKIPT